jgi:hypothetical protein
MEDLFRSYWWLLFPMAWFIGAGWQSWMNYRTRRDALKLVQTYAERGQEPPPELMAAINRRDDDALMNGGFGGETKPSTTNWGWYQAALFGALAGGFAFLARSNILGDEGLADAMTVAAVVLAALALASLVYALTWKRPQG